MSSSADDGCRMTRPPGKRPRRLILSDDDEPMVKTRRAPPRLSAGPVKGVDGEKIVSLPATPKKVKPKPVPKASPNRSPEKTLRKGNREEKGSKSLHTFFGKATEEQRWARKENTPSTVDEDVETADAIEDDSSDEAFADYPNGGDDEDKVLDRRKAGGSDSWNDVMKPFKNGISSSHKFAKLSKPVMKDKTIVGQDNDMFDRPWAERFAPESLEELAVHKKKVTDVQNWLSAVLQGRDRRVCDP